MPLNYNNQVIIPSPTVPWIKTPIVPLMPSKHRTIITSSPTAASLIPVLWVCISLIHPIILSQTVVFNTMQKTLRLQKDPYKIDMLKLPQRYLPASKHGSLVFLNQYNTHKYSLTSKHSSKKSISQL